MPTVATPPPSVTKTDADPAALIAFALQSITGLATLPEVTSKIVQTVEDPRSNASSLQRIVSTDPALVTRVLKLVNSAFYGLPGQVASIERAIVLLGLNAIKNVAVAASLGQMFRGVQLCEGFTAKDLWTHCLAVASASRELCKQARLPFADEAFLAGMVHDIGLLIELQVWPEKLRQACDRARMSTIDFAQIEREAIGVSHTQLGQALCEKWKFPAACRAVAGFHHEPANERCGDADRGRRRGGRRAGGGGGLRLYAHADGQDRRRRDARQGRLDAGGGRGDATPTAGTRPRGLVAGGLTQPSLNKTTLEGRTPIVRPSGVSRPSAITSRRHRRRGGSAARTKTSRRGRACCRRRDRPGAA